MTTILEFRLDDADRAWLKLRVHGRERPDFTDSDDHNWLQSGVEVRSGRMAGSVSCSLRTEDLAEFRGGLASLTDNAAAEALCKTMEDRLAIQMRRGGSGRLAVKGHIADAAEGNRLEFSFGVAVDGIPMLLQQLDVILDAYPTR